MRLMAFRIPLLAAALAAGALVAPSLAAAHGPDRHGRGAVVPVQRVGHATAGEFLSEFFAPWYAAAAPAPAPAPPEPCRTVGRRHRALIYSASDEPATCVVRRGTAVVVPAPWIACSDVEAPPFFGADEAAQRACDLATSPPAAYTVQVDGRAPVDIDTDRFAVFSPQTTVQVPPEHPEGLPAGPATFVAYGWIAQVRGLDRGRHTIAVHVVGSDDDDVPGPDFDVRSSLVVVIIGGRSR